jgi:cysteine-rich repeat protein
VVDSGEACDYNNPNPPANSPVCRFNCTLVACGDGIFDPGEECDQGANNGPNAACDVDCTANTVCGDGVRDSNEKCDNGAHCANGAQCTLGGASCGDGSTCRARSGDGCSRYCFYEYCGNANGVNGPVGQLDPGEQCDDGNNQSGDGCSSICRFEAVCGNGTFEPALGEQCDASDASDPNRNVCSSICTIQQFCGDGVVTTSAGEQCEPPGTNTCTADCRTRVVR